MVSTAGPDQVCEACGRLLVEGEPIYGTVAYEYGADPYGLDPRTSDFDPLNSTESHGWRDHDCYVADVPITPAAQRRPLDTPATVT